MYAAMIKGNITFYIQDRQSILTSSRGSVAQGNPALTLKETTIDDALEMFELFVLHLQM